MALLDGTIVTQLRTGAASALASKYLSRADSSHLWGRRPGCATATLAAIQSLVNHDIEVLVPKSIEEAVA